MAKASPMNRGYGTGLAANRAPTTGLAANRAPSTGLAAGAPAGGAFRSSFQASNTMAPNKPAPAMAPTQPAPMPGMPPMPPPTPEPPPPVDFSNMWGSQPLPAPGQQSFNQQPPSPFGPAPLPFGGYRQEGGPVQPGQAYIVGEAGPELIVPQQPGMVLPNQTLTGRASAQDGAVRSGPLSTRGATPVGSGRGMTPERRLEIAARRGDQRANLALFNADQWGRAGRGAGRGLPPMPMPMARAPLPPSAARPMPNFPPRSPAQQPPPEPMAAPQFDMSNMLPPMVPAQRPGVPQVPAGFENMMPSLSTFDPMAPLPPSTLMGGTGMPPAPDFQVNNVGSFEVLTQNTPNGPKFYNARVAPDTAPAPGMTTAGYRMLDDYNRQNPDKPLVFTGQFEPNGNPVLAPAPLEQPTERVTERDDATGTTRTYTQPRGVTPAPGPGPAGGAAPIERTTSSGVKVQVSMPDQAERMTGQMPNEAYANPLTPEQSLAAARAEYLRTGDDAALRKHFQQFPNQASQLRQQEAKVWQQIGAQTGRMATEAQMRGQQQADRSAYIDQYSKSPFTQGAIAAEYDANFPQDTTMLGQAPMRPDFALMAQANELNRQAEIAAGRTPPPASAAYIPAPAPVTPMTQAQRNPGGIMARWNRLPPMPVLAPTVKRKPRAA